LELTELFVGLNTLQNNSDQLMNAYGSKYHLIFLLVLAGSVLYVVITFNFIPWYLSNTAKNEVDKVNKYKTKTITQNTANFTLQPLVLLFEGGCVGSSATNQFLNDVVIEHGLKKYENKKFAYFNNKKYKETRDNLDVAIEDLSKDKLIAQKKGQVMYIKLQFKKFGLIDSIADIGVDFVIVLRKNILDSCICSARDCFLKKDNGYAVFAKNGTKAPLCFQRRFHPEIETKVFFTKHGIQHCLKQSQTKQREMQKMFNFQVVYYEELFAFEYTSSDVAFEQSKHAWETIARVLLKNKFDKSKLVQTLQKYRGSRQLMPNENLLFNNREIMNDLKGTEWEKYIRRSNSSLL